MRGGLAPLQERLCGPTRPWALLRVLFSARIEAIDQVAEPVGNSLVHDLVIHCAQLLTQTRLHVSTQLRRFRIDFFATRRRLFHLILLSHGLSFFHCSPQTAGARAGYRYPPWFCAKPLTEQMVPRERNFFAALALARYRLIVYGGRRPQVGRSA